jgi:hypothetical protein
MSRSAILNDIAVATRVAIKGAQRALGAHPQDFGRHRIANGLSIYNHVRNVVLYSAPGRVVKEQRSIRLHSRLRFQRRDLSHSHRVAPCLKPMLAIDPVNRETSLKLGNSSDFPLVASRAA